MPPLPSSHDNLDLYGNDVGHITSIQVKLKKDGLFFDDWDLDWVRFILYMSYSLVQAVQSIEDNYR